MNAGHKDPEGLMTAEEAARYLGFAKGTIYQKVSKGEIPYLKLGHSVRFRRSELDRWIAEQNAASTSP